MFQELGMAVVVKRRQTSSTAVPPSCGAPRSYRSKSSSTFSVAGWDWQART